MNKWNEKYLHEVVDIRVSNVDKKIYSNKSLVKLCNYMDVYSNDYISSQISFSIGSADKNEVLRFGLLPDDVIITKDSESPDDIAVSTVVVEEIKNLVCGYHLAILRPDKEQIDGRFLMFKLKGNDLKSYFGRAAKGSTRFGLTIGDIEKAPLAFPSLPIQRKISHILCTVDAVIEKTQSAIAKYEAIKQGMLHDLFTRGIDLQTGKLRPKYQDAPELYKESKLGWIPRDWEENQLGKCGSFRKGSNIPKYSLSHFGKGCVLYGQLYTAFENVIENTLSKIPDDFTKGMIPVKWGSILFAGSGETHEEIGKSAVLLVNEEIYAGGDIIILELNDVYYSPYFGYYLNFYSIQNQKSVFGQGSTVVHIYANHLFAITVALPSKKEQEIIFKLIDQLNKKLSTEENYMHKVQQIKAGLMGDLLSGENEVKVKDKEEVLHG